LIPNDDPNTAIPTAILFSFQNRRRNPKIRDIRNERTSVHQVLNDLCMMPEVRMAMLLPMERYMLFIKTFPPTYFK
jgi:hypothetical protein